MARLDPQLTVELVLLAVELVPPGRVVAYGDIAALVATTPRRVGTIMAQRGGEVAWWRVTNAKGELPAHLSALATRRWDDEGISHLGSRCRIARHRADLDALAHRFHELAAPETSPDH